MRDAGNIHEIEQLGVDMIGLIFYPKSPRYVNMVSSHSGIIPDKAAKGMDNIAGGNGKVKLVGVFVDDLPQNIITRIYNYRLDFVQLHGEETPEMIQNLKRTVVPDIRKELKVIKAISIADKTDLEKCRQYEGIADLLLFDTKCSTAGGSGEKYDWTILSAYEGTTPFMLGGGIPPDAAARIKAFTHPMFYGIDLNSRFETEPGIKDATLIETFMKRL